MATDATVRITAQNDTAKAFRDIINSGNEAGESLKRAFEAAFVGISVASFADHITSAIEYGDAIGKAADKSGMAVEQFSALAYAAKNTDVDLGALEKGVKSMQVAIASGSDAFDRLGVNLDALKRLSPDQQFDVLAEAISRVQDPAERTKDAVDLFGKAGADLLPLLTQGAAGVEKLKTEAKDLGAVLDESAKKEIAAADDAIKKFHASNQSLWRTLAIQLAPAIANTADSYRLLTGHMGELETAQNRVVFLNQRIAQDMKERADNPGPGGDSKQMQDWVRELAALNARIMAITSKSNAPIMDGLLGTPAENKAVIDQISDGWDALYNKITGFTTKFHADQDKAANAAAAKEQQRIDAEDQATMTEIEKKDAAWTEFYAKLDDLRAKSKITADQYAQRSAEFESNWLDEAVVTVKKLPVEHQKAMDEMSEYSKRAAQNMQDSLATFLYDPFHAGLRGMLTDFIDTLRKMASQVAAQKIMESSGASDWFSKILKTIFSSSTSSGSLDTGVNSFVGNDVYAGQYATGGSFTVGGTGGTDSQLVAMHATPGEQVTIARPDRGQGGGSSPVTINTTIDARGATTDLVAALPGILKRNNEQLHAKILDGIRRKRTPI